MTTSARGSPTVVRRRLVDGFAGFPVRLAGAARVADAAPPVDGEWTTEQVVRHLIAVEIAVHQARLHDVEVDDAPEWAWAEPGPWDGEPDLDLDGLLARFAELRAATVARVRALDGDAWRRAGTHATYGLLDVAGLLGLAIDHDAEHLRDLEAR